ncbi:MAG: hypothetical protein AB1578_21785 [Thermodesulfobacteriota bacterium]
MPGLRRLSRTLALAAVLLAACAPLERIPTHRDIRPPDDVQPAAAPAPPPPPLAPPAAAAERGEALPVPPAAAAERKGAPTDHRPRAAPEPERPGELLQQEASSAARQAKAAAQSLGEGEERYRIGDWAEAGTHFGRALELLPAGEGSFGDAGWTRSRVEGRIRDCSQRLMEAGLLRYRTGDLPGAIDTWRKIAAFDPSFEDARRSIETATAQQRNLEKIR